MASHGLATQGREGNGGDPTEPEFKEIALNIQQWILSGNANHIVLPQTIPLAAYKKKMLAVLGSYHISFVTGRVTVGGAEKTCENFIDKQGNEIICNNSSWDTAYENNIDDIYRTVHHEFAGLAGMEKNTGADSDYTISDQISGYLRNTVVKRLPVVKSPSGRIGDIARNYDGSILEMSWYDASGYCACDGGPSPTCSGLGSRLPTAREYAEYAQSLGAAGIRARASEGAPLSSNFYFSTNLISHDLRFTWRKN